ncbi:hypothetical protein [Demetria terragena]|uniref:hypothetical protein n=1 Tax=Demetria terragena TaxID=63959 RepID=UPI0003651DB3|nr:hypothetical protein [Demetria terragena]
MTAFVALPDFSARLAALLRAYGLNGNSLSAELRSIGVGCSPQHAYRLLNFPDGQVPKLSAELLAGILHVCPVEPQYFFDGDVGDLDERLTAMYVERTEPANRRPGPRPRP